ncbi:MAG: YqeG family HAD IIIA-type phosphatase [Eubacteriales bacterium]
MSFLQPDYYFEHFREVTPDFLAALGVRALVLDLDNTIARYEDAEPSDEVLAWFAGLHEAGVRTAFVSNNKAARVELFNRKLAIPIFAASKKPFIRSMKEAMRVLESHRENTAVMGDQIFTDVLAGKWAGVRTILVSPLKDKTDCFTRLKRLFERPILAAYHKREEKKKHGK